MTLLVYFIALPIACWWTWQLLCIWPIVWSSLSVASMYSPLYKALCFQGPPFCLWIGNGQWVTSETESILTQDIKFSLTSCSVLYGIQHYVFCEADTYTYSSGPLHVHKDIVTSDGYHSFSLLFVGMLDSWGDNEPEGKWWYHSVYF